MCFFYINRDTSKRHIVCNDMLQILGQRLIRRFLSVAATIRGRTGIEPCLLLALVTLRKYSPSRYLQQYSSLPKRESDNCKTIATVHLMLRDYCNTLSFLTKSYYFRSRQGFSEDVNSSYFDFVQVLNLRFFSRG